MPPSYALGSSRPVRSRSKPPGFILPGQPALSGAAANRARLAARDQVRRIPGDRPQRRRASAPMGQTTSDYSEAFTRIRDAVAALQVESAVLDDEAIILRPDNSFYFEALRSRQGQAEANRVLAQPARAILFC